MDTWMPNGYKCDDRIGEKVAQMYNLLESDGGYTKRDRQNAGMYFITIIYISRMKELIVP